MQNDPHTPILEAHIPTLLAGSFSSLGTLGVEDLADPERIQRSLDASECIVADAGRDSDLEALVRAVPEPEGVLWVGSAGLAHALGRVYPGPRAEDADEQRALRARPVLVVVGSLSGVAREQVLRLADEFGEIAVPVGSGVAVEKAAAAARKALAGRSCAVVHSLEERDASGEAVLGSLAEVVALLSEEGAFGGMVLTGGATAVGAARRLGAFGIMLGGEVESGVPIGTLIGPRPYPVVTKAGGFGGPDTLVEAVEALAQREEERRR